MENRSNGEILLYEEIIITMGEDETEALEQEVVVEVVEVLAQECHHFLRLSAGWE